VHFYFSKYILGNKNNAKIYFLTDMVSTSTTDHMMDADFHQFVMIKKI